MLEQQKNETTYLFATIGSRTERGGRVTKVTSKAEYRGMALARVGDVVTYDDGSEATYPSAHPVLNARKRGAKVMPS